MATAIGLDPVSELRQMVGGRDGVEPLITIADDTALVSFQLPGGDVHGAVAGTASPAGHTAGQHATGAIRPAACDLPFKVVVSAADHWW